MTVELHFSEDLVRKAVLAFWWRVIGWRYLAASSLILGGFVWFVAAGDRSWWVGLLGASLGLAVAFAVAVYVVHYRALMARFRRMRQPRATLELGEDRFRVSSDVGTSELVWTALTEVWTLPDFLLLFFSKSQFMTLPRADLGRSGCEFILRKAEASGAKIS